MIPSPRSEWFYPKADTPTVDSLDGRPAALSATSVFAAVSSWFPDSGAVELIADGTFNSVWGFESDGRRLAIKGPRSGRPQTGGDAGYSIEGLALELAAAAGVDTPRVEALDRSRTAVPFDFLITEREDGVSLSTLDKNEDAVLACYPAMARTLRLTHKVALAGFGLCVPSDTGLRGSVDSWRGFLSRRLDEHLLVLSDSALISTGESARIREILDPLTLLEDCDARLLHGDCGPHNMIRRPTGRVALIDWEDAIAGDPLFELAQWATFNPRRRWSAMLDQYQGRTWVPDDLFRLYFLRITLAKLVVRSRLGLADPPGRPTARERLDDAVGALRP